MTKRQFIQDEIWLLSTFGAFQRSNCYSSSSSENERRVFREKLRKFIDENLLKNYDIQVSEKEHLENILAIQKFTLNYSLLLKNDKLNFGICQKLFNLYLKYLWCLNELPSIPPQFPVDRIIQEKLGIKNIQAWTQFENPEPYIYVINIAKEYVKNTDFNNLAELELNLFKR